MDTGSSSDAELARCVHAYTCGLGRIRRRTAVSCTTGVSSTTVVSRLSSAVVIAARPNTPRSSRAGEPRRASRAPAALNSPSRWQTCATTRIAPRKASTGSSRPASSRAWSSGSAPVRITTAAAGTATTASGSRFGRVIAVISTAASSTPDSASAGGPASAPDATLAADSAWVPSLAARPTIVRPRRRSLA